MTPDATFYLVAIVGGVIGACFVELAKAVIESTGGGSE